MSSSKQAVYPRITLSGLDETTPAAFIESLSQEPQVEFGLLYTTTPEGRPRYPSRDWISRTAAKIDRHGHCSIHICGRGAREALLKEELDDLVMHADRIQVNGQLLTEEVEQICDLYPDHEIITQHATRNLHLLAVKASNHSLLVDASAGTGTLPSLWLRPKTHKEVGFAGGLGPLNLADQLPLIRNVARGDWWIDMESAIRTNDMFDYVLATSAAFHIIGRQPHWVKLFTTGSVK